MEQKDCRGVEFFGKITAEFTHEMKNVLAIIKESAGLMEDLLAMGNSGAFPHLERLGRSISTIRAQVERGVEMSTRLNRFAHSPDAPVAEVELCRAVEQVVLLTQRFARLRNVMVVTESASEGLNLETSPFALQMALFHGLQHGCSLLPSGGSLTVRTAAGLEGAEVTFHCEGESRLEDPTLSPSWSVLGEVVQGIGGGVAAGLAGFVMVLPAVCRDEA